ncbi:MAG TPA: CopG family transcriptional regulator [Bacillota bacterium]|nr:CopG family transcriptional regulator [Bacillota bacterium]HQD19641.1 CopG family transcriptional regulator [Bacillota bacterium]
MYGQEKITLNLNAVDLAKVDYLAEQGFYSSRSDFIRTAIRNQLREHEAIVSDEALSNLVQWEKHGERVKSIGGIGVISLSRRQLEDLAAQGSRLKIFIVGTLAVGKDVTVDLLEQVLDSARIYGVVKGTQEVTDYFRSIRGK